VRKRRVVESEIFAHPSYGEDAVYRVKQMLQEQTKLLKSLRLQLGATQLGDNPTGMAQQAELLVLTVQEYDAAEGERERERERFVMVVVLVLLVCNLLLQPFPPPYFNILFLYLIWEQSFAAPCAGRTTAFNACIESYPSCEASCTTRA
tara:strand:+ start:42 stop:488 length:447 start_codon:yes stop_codon:yes gene_type:complete